MAESAKQHLAWAAERALEYFDRGDKKEAIASFLSDVGKHSGTAWIQGEGMFLLLLDMEYDRGRIAFERFMLGFAVHDVTA